MDEDGDMRRRCSGRATAALHLDISCEGPRWTCIRRPGPLVLARRVASAVAAAGVMEQPTASAALMLSTDAGVRELNRRWRGLDKPTNVLSFPSPRPSAGGIAPGSSCHLGDVIVARETLTREACDLRIPVADHYSHLVLHGLLHLLGFDHESDSEAAEMEALETRILAGLGVPDPYAAGPLADTAAPLARRKPNERSSTRPRARSSRGEPGAR